MTYYAATVAVRHADTPQQAIEMAQEALAPYDENLAVTPYLSPFDPQTIKTALRHAEKPTDTTDHDTIAAAVQDWCGADTPQECYRTEADGTITYGETSTRNPQGYWDWYSVGGRYEDRFTVAPGTASSPTVAQVKDIDFATMEKVAVEAATKEYDAFEKATRGLEVPIKEYKALTDASEAMKDVYAAEIPEEVYRERKDALHAAQDAFWSTPFSTALHESDLTPFLADPFEYWKITTGGREAFIESDKNFSWMTLVLLSDGEWYALGPVGWFGAAEEVVPEGEFCAGYRERVENLPGDTWLVVMDLHT